MRVPPEIAEAVRARTERAEEDLLLAGHALTLGERCPFALVAFHAQQCIEKYLKALLTLHAVPFRKTHDLGELLPLVPATAKLDLDLDEVSPLTLYSVAGRYPGDMEPVTREEAEGVLRVARKARDTVRAAIPEEARGAR